MTVSRPLARAAQFAALTVIALGATAAQAQAQAASAPQAASRFTISADGNEVTDTTTKLTWRRCAEGQKFDGKTCAGKPTKLKFGAAKEAATAAGGGWRVPTRDEITALLAKGKLKKGDARFDAQAFPGTPKVLFWATRPGFDDNLNAWLVNFQSGKVDGNSGAGKYALRLVK